ncbi:MAG: AraC family transcriptional regulator [Planctomycetaceae bacterium]|nr:AraC family transcriptional regulator [Planctomycetaceae bacterium]
MRPPRREVRFDPDLRLEVCLFDGLSRGFPSHFHDYYVLGLVESGGGGLKVGGQTREYGAGDILVFHPMESHACEQTDGTLLTFRSFNIRTDSMAQAIGGDDTVDSGHGSGGIDAVAGAGRADGEKRVAPRFDAAVIRRSPQAERFGLVHEEMIGHCGEAGRAARFREFLRLLCRDHARPVPDGEGAATAAMVEAVCQFIDDRYGDRITLDDLEAIAHINKFSLIRAFTRWKGITPYRYLEAVRIGRARELLEQGVEPVTVAGRVGFSDQSHFSRFFKLLIGVTPGEYQGIFRHE